MSEEKITEVCFYEGKDLSLKEKPCCVTCARQDCPSLRRCSRCKLVRYCSRECQVEDFPKHKWICKEIQRCTERLEKEEIELRSFSRPVDVFLEEVGHFWSLHATRDYMRARLSLAESSMTVAERVLTAEAWITVKDHYQEMLRLSMRDNQGLRFRFPFILIHLNRDDEAYGFCTDWLNYDFDGKSLTERGELHASSRENDYLYSREEDCRFKDIFEECPRAMSKISCLVLITALAVIKLRLVAHYESYRRTMRLVFSETSGGKMLAEVAPLVSDMLVGETEIFKAKMEPQREQLDRILDAIDRRNPTLLKALLNPDPLLSQQKPRVFYRRRPSEAYFVLEKARPYWPRISGAKELLAERFGTDKPTYETDMKDE